MSEAVFIKLGGSLITDKTKPLTALPSVITQICTEVAMLYRSRPDITWFLGNGVGSYGHYMVHETGWRENRTDMSAVARIRQSTALLNQMILSELIAQGVPALTMAPAGFSLSSDQSYDTHADPLLKYAELHAVPVVYGDVVATTDGSTAIMSTEDVLHELALAWQQAGHTVAQVIYCTSVGGVLDANGTTIPQLTADAVDSHIGAASGFDVTGGMKQKVAAGFRALECTHNVHIINGTVPGQLTACIAGQPVGTLLVAN